MNNLRNNRCIPLSPRCATKTLGGSSPPLIATSIVSPLNRVAEYTERLSRNHTSYWPFERLNSSLRIWNATRVVLSAFWPTGCNDDSHADTSRPVRHADALSPVKVEYHYVSSSQLVFTSVRVRRPSFTKLRRNKPRGNIVP